MRTHLTSLLAATLAAAALLAAPAAAHPAHAEMRANVGAPELQPAGADERHPTNWLLIVAGLAGATIVAGGSASGIRSPRFA